MDTTASHTRHSSGWQNTQSSHARWELLSNQVLESRRIFHQENEKKDRTSIVIRVAVVNFQLCVVRRNSAADLHSPADSHFPEWMMLLLRGPQKLQSQKRVDQTNPSPSFSHQGNRKQIICCRQSSTPDFVMGDLWPGICFLRMIENSSEALTRISGNRSGIL